MDIKINIYLLLLLPLFCFSCIPKTPNEIDFEKGLQLGDSIVSVNGKQILDLSQEDMLNEIRKENKPVDIKILRNKDTKEITFYPNYLL